MATSEPEELLRRIETEDASLWPEGNVSPTRLGWLSVPREMDREARDLRRWADTIDQDTVILLGMGGSSLGPLVFGELAAAFGAPKGRRLFVCDTTEPTTIESMPFEDAFVLVSSKSGTTLEPNALFDYALSRLKDPRRYGVITDPGTPLAQRAAELRVNRVFANRPDIGGRYSVLSYFGVIPAALLGYDIDELVGRALEIDRLAAVALGIELATSALGGADKATIEISSSHRSLATWLEQLLAESTGKGGRGIVPVPTSDDERGDDRIPVPIALDNAHEAAAWFYRLELATAAAGHVLEIDPFDEPNVAESKANTTAVLAKLPLPKLESVTPHDAELFLEESLRPGDYVSLQAYLPFGLDAELESLRRRIRDTHGGIAVTAGYGPRFLHSTGQLHKGGPNSIVAVQIVPRAARPSLPIPGGTYDFATLIDAQAIGDFQSLVSHGRRVVRVALDDLGELA